MMASAAAHPQSPPRKKARLSLKLIRKEQQQEQQQEQEQPVVPEESRESAGHEPSSCDVPDDTQPVYPELGEPESTSSSCIPSEYVITVAPYTGLHNLGNTCYLNSVLQVLRYCPGFAENLERLSDVVATVLKIKEDTEEDDREDERSRRRRKEFISQLRLVQKLNKLFKTMSEKEESYLARMMPSGQELAMYPEDILEAIRDLNPMFKGYLQHDAQELLCCILSNVQEACQMLCSEQQQTQSGSGAMEGSSHQEVPEPAMRAVRRLDMGAAGDSAPVAGSTDCGKLLGGGRFRGSRSHPHTKLLEEGRPDGGAVAKHNKESDCTKALTNGHMNGEHRDELCNGTGSKGKKGLGMLIGSPAGGISPSNDSVRRRGARKSGLTNGHLSSKESNGLDTEDCPVKDGAGDCRSSKKKRLGMGRFVTFQQTTLLNKFGVIKKEKSQSLDDHESKDASDNPQAMPTTDIKLELSTSSSKVAECRNVTCNNSNSPDQSLDAKSENRVEGMKTVREESGEQDFGKCESMPLETEIDEPTESLNPAVSKTVTSLIDDSKLPLDDGACGTAATSATGAVADGSTAASSVVSETVNSKLPLDDAACGSAATSGTEASAVSSVAREMRMVEGLFRGTLVLRTRCLECDSCSEKREDFQDVSVPVQSIPAFTDGEDDDPTPDVNPRNLSLSWALSEFTSVERLTDENKYYCEHCFHLTEAERSVLFGRLPGVLIIQLKRFSAFINCFSPGGSVSKVNDHLAVPRTLSLARWCARSCGQRDRVFELCAVVAHSGSSSSSGHYVAYTRVPHRVAGQSQFGGLTDGASAAAEQSSEDTWANFDDDRVTMMSEEDFASFVNPLPGNESPATPYLLMYRQRPWAGIT